MCGSKSYMRRAINKDSHKLRLLTEGKGAMNPNKSTDVMGIVLSCGRQKMKGDMCDGQITSSRQPGLSR
jgi:hypothetical protein